jgi:hypothetical protein
VTDLTNKTVPVVETEKTAADEIYIDSRVVSLAEINERLGNARKLFIAPKSILTPSAKDEIRKRKIEVAVKLPSLTVPSGSVIWLALQQPVLLATNWENRLRKELKLKQESFATLAELLDEAERQLSNEKTHGVALTKQSATAIRLANRRDTIRAIGGIDPKQTAEDTAELNANLLVIHPERISNAQIFEIIKRFSK